MSKREKLLNKLRNVTAAGADASDVETLLFRYGFRLERVRGSHHGYLYDDGERKETIVVPVHNNHVKIVYVVEIVNLIDQLFPKG